MAVQLQSGSTAPFHRKILPLNRRLWFLVFCLTRALFKPFFSIRTEGRHHLPSKKGFLLLPKHQYWQDIPLLGLAVNRPLYYIAKYELFRYPIVQPVLHALGGIPLNREKPFNTRRAFRDAVAVLERGEGLVIFPEGTYVKNSMGRGHSGMLRFILKRIQVPIIPVGIQYCRSCRPTKVRIRFGTPMKCIENSVEMKQIMTEIAGLSALQRSRV